MNRQEIYQLVEAERERQIAKGYNQKHDDKLRNEFISCLSAYYILGESYTFINEELYSNCDYEEREKDVALKERYSRKQQLINGIALAVAELERLERLELK